MHAIDLVWCKQAFYIGSPVRIFQHPHMFEDSFPVILGILREGLDDTPGNLDFQ
jgi:hypothetical protein